MKKRTFIMGLAALALAFGSAGVIGGVSLGAGNSAILTKAAVGDDIKIGEGTYKEIYRTGFENATTGSNYQQTQNYEASATDGLAWKIYYGTVSTSATLSDDKSAQMRLYKDKNCGYMMNTTALSETVNAFQFAYAVSNKNVKFDVDYSTDGSSWTTIETVSPSSTAKTTYSHEFATGLSDFRLRIAVSKTSTFPSSSNYTFRVDDVVFAHKSTDPTVSVDGDSDVTLKKDDSKDLSLIVENMPEGGTLSAESDDPSIATVSITDNVLSVTGVSVGETLYTVTMKNSEGTEVASFIGTITVSVGATGVTVVSDFEDNDTLRIGTTHELLAEVEPSEAAQDVVWTVSDSEAATISSDDVLSIVKKTSEDLITVTATSATDSSVFATLSFYVSNEFEISELVSQDGTTLPNGLVKGSSVVSTKGTVTAIEGNNVYIQSGDAAIDLYATDTSLSSLKIGDGVKASGTITMYNGLVELTSPSATVDESVKEDIVPVEITSENMVAANISRFVVAHNAKCLASKTISGTDNITLSFELSNGTSISLHFKKSCISKLSSYGNFVKDSYYDIKGLYNVYNSSNQILMVEGCSYYAAGTEEVEAFIASYITGKDGAPTEGDTCKAKYTAAKAAYDGLSDNAKTLFSTSSAYADAYKVYTYWENHQNDATAVKHIGDSDSTSWTNLAVISGAILLTATSSIFLIRSKKKQDR